ncbi:hypothetical protein ABH931_000896 [Streptacidiphilus sp. MAP12-33]|uniref:SMI1/KNR4 family protein n=1 Tax=Streptacidiphilus sp. MAP12-33 TaxID=3156266 RepID=UPI003512BDF5
MNRRDEILRLLPPPAREVPPADWSAVATHLGTDLPTAYTWFVETYGTGSLGADGVEWMTFLHPNQELAASDLVGWMERGQRFLQHRKEYGYDPYPGFPEPGFLAAFATSPAGYEFYLRVDPDSDPDAWTVVWHDYALDDDRRWTEFPQGFEGFLYDLIRGRIPERITSESGGYTEYLPQEPGTSHHYVPSPDPGPDAPTDPRTAR